ncbi:MAG: HlyD family efflux transporter periplasmic adaptor subunit [Selenomonadaceae bacterium]|nr:HlyD family efflux transporter periplasmic adaptor subunit [Selenomonadaceae bacterium]MDD7055932.1 HlyD family efflux transporter periplasmic adaptor subunit [Selenomonadaceae bacterium]
MRKIIAILLSALLVLASLGCGSQAESKVEWGRADAKEIDVNSKVAGRVVELLVKEGDEVKAGQVIARIDKRDLEAKKAGYEANIAAIEAQQLQAASVTSMQTGTTQSALAAAQHAQDKAASDLALAQADYQRYSDLVASGAVSRQVFEQYQTKYEVAQSTYEQAGASVRQAQAALGQRDVDTANEAATAKKLEQAQAALQEVEVSLDETEIRAPFDGIITEKYVEEGSMISNGTPLVAVQDPTDNWVDLKVPETQLADFRVGQDLTLVGRDGKTKVTGTITDISKKAEFATQRATSERGDASDIVSFNVKIQINDPVLRPGMRFRLAGDAS